MKKKRAQARKPTARQPKPRKVGRAAAAAPPSGDTAATPPPPQATARGGP